MGAILRSRNLTAPERTTALSPPGRRIRNSARGTLRIVAYGSVEASVINR
jgi:hypothetical protein